MKDVAKFDKDFSMDWLPQQKLGVIQGNGRLVNHLIRSLDLLSKTMEE